MKQTTQPKEYPAVFFSWLHFHITMKRQIEEKGEVPDNDTLIIHKELPEFIDKNLRERRRTLEHGHPEYEELQALEDLDEIAIKRVYTLGEIKANAFDEIMSTMPTASVLEKMGNALLGSHHYSYDITPNAIDGFLKFIKKITDAHKAHNL